MTVPSLLTKITPWTERAAVRRHAVPVLLIIVITCVFFAPRLLGLTFSAVGHHRFATYPWRGLPMPAGVIFNRGYPQTDHAETYYPLSVFATQAWRSGQLPLWMPYSFGGFPILELGMTSLLYPPRLLLIPFFDPIWQHDLLLFLHLLGAGLGMYGLLRAWGCGAAGAVLGAVAWQFNGHNLFWLVIEQMAIVAAWTPLMLLAATLAVRRQSLRWAVAAGLAVGVALYSGGTHYVHWSGWLLALWYGTDVLRAAVGAGRARKTKTALGYLLLPVVSLGVALLVGLAYWLPLWNALKDVSRQPASFEWQLARTFPLKVLLNDAWLPRGARQMAPPPDFESVSFVGLIVLALALVALLMNRSRHTWIAFGFVLAAVLTLTGVRPWLWLLHDRLPFFSTMQPILICYLLCFALAVMAAFGLDELLRRWRMRPVGRGRVWLWATSVLVVVAAVAQTSALAIWPLRFVWRVALEAAQHPLPTKARLALIIIAGATVAALLRLRYAQRRGAPPREHSWRATHGLAALGYGLAALLAVDLTLFAWTTTPFHPAYPEFFYPETPLLARAQELQRQWRMLPLYYNAEAWTPPVLVGKIGAIFRLQLDNGYESLLPARTTALWQTVANAGAPTDEPLLLAFHPYYLHDRVPLRLLENLSIGLLLTPPGVEPLDNGRNLVADGTLRNVYQGVDGWIYENPRALQRAFLVPQVVEARDGAEALRLLADRNFDARQAAIIEPPFTLALRDDKAAPRFDDNAARIVRESLNQVEVETSAERAALLVLNDSWAAQWRATVDGAPQPVARVNFNARGVAVPAGRHHVVFRYRPTLLLWSLTISGVTTLLLLLWLLSAPLYRLTQRAGAPQTRSIN